MRVCSTVTDLRVGSGSCSGSDIQVTPRTSDDISDIVTLILGSAMTELGIGIVVAVTACEGNVPRLRTNGDSSGLTDRTGSSEVGTVSAVSQLGVGTKSIATVESDIT